MKKNNLVAGLEIGRTNASMVVLEKDPKSLTAGFVAAVKVPLGASVRKGSILNLENITEAIIKLTEDISHKDKRRLGSVFVNISGPDIRPQISHPVTALAQRGCEITEKNVADLLESCKIVSVPLERHLLYLNPLEYIVDDQAGVKNPIGLYGSRLEANVLIVTAPFNQVQNIVKAVNFAGLDAEQVLLTNVALADSVLSEDEKKRGVLLIDMKTDLTEFGIFREGLLLFFDAIPKGQADIIDEISSRFDIPYELAQDLKKRYAFLGAQDDRRNQENIPVDWMGKNRNIVRGELNRILASNLDFIFEGILESVKKYRGFNNAVKAGAVICGGAVNTEGFMERSGQRLGFTVRQATLRKALSAGLDDSYMTALGLAEFGLKARQDTGANGGGFLKSVFNKTGELLADYF